MDFKNIFVVIFMLFCTLLPVQSRSIDESTARKIAGGLLSGIPAPVKTKGIISSATEPFYIFNSSKGGFVIISGDDSVEPVIGYSEQGEFVTKDMPDNIKWWLGMWADQIKANVSRGDVADDEIRAQWEALESGKQLATSSQSKLIETAKWDQGNPYNQLCPYNGVTGCVATATAIVMRYFKYPEKGSGTLSGYDYTIGTEARHVDGHSLGTKYDWDNMPLEYKGTETTAQKQAVAQLMYDIGVMVEMQYDSKGSAAYTEVVPSKLKQYMGYDKSSNEYYYVNYKTSEWQDLLKKHIDEVGPGIYSGSGAEGGHAFVVDGYDATGRFHVNFGWSGTNNGYYTVGAFRDFVNYQTFCAVLPDKGGKDYHYMSITSYNNSTGLTCDTKNFVPGVTFNGSCDWVYNQSYEDFKGEFAVARISRDGLIQEVVGRMSRSLQAGYMTKFNFQGSFTAIEIGDYMTLVTKMSDSDEWIPAQYDRTDSKLVGVIPLADEKSLEEETSLKYTLSSGIMLISTKKDATWTLKTELGADASSAASWSETTGTISIDTKQLTAGKYVLVLSKGTDTKTLNFTFGTK